MVRIMGLKDKKAKMDEIEAEGFHENVGKKGWG